MRNRKIRRDYAAAVIFSGLLAWVLASSPLLSQIDIPGLIATGTPANNDCSKFVVIGGQVSSITTAGGPCALSSGANPSASAGPAAINGSATTFMRSDAAPAVQKGSTAQFGIVEADGTGICSATLGIFNLCNAYPVGANPSATAGPAAINGSATTFMRSDAAPAVQLGTASVPGIVQPDGTIITVSGGTITVAKCGAAAFGVCEVDNVTIKAPSNVLTVQAITVGGQNVSPGGTATVQGNGAKIQTSTGTTTTNDCVKFDADGNTVDNGAACGTASGANPTAAAGPSAVNGSAGTFMRSDAAPAVQKGTNAQFGIVEGDGTTITCVLGVCSNLGVTSIAGNAGAFTLTNGLTNSTNALGLTVGQLPGIATNTVASAGNIGEVLSSDVTLTGGSQVGLVSNTPANITSKVLTAGHWEISGTVCVEGGSSTSVTNYFIGINTSSATLPANPGVETFAYAVSRGATMGLSSGAQPQCNRTGTADIYLSGSTTYYLVAQYAFTVSTLTGYGLLTARRVQ